jgi:hypothetical protein
MVNSIYCPGCKRYFSLVEQRISTEFLSKKSRQGWLCFQRGCEEVLDIPPEQRSFNFWKETV